VVDFSGEFEYSVVFTVKREGGREGERERERIGKSE